MKIGREELKNYVLHTETAPFMDRETLKRISRANGFEKSRENGNFIVVKGEDPLGLYIVSSFSSAGGLEKIYNVYDYDAEKNVSVRKVTRKMRKTLEKAEKSVEEKREKHPELSSPKGPKMDVRMR